MRQLALVGFALTVAMLPACQIRTSPHRTALSHVVIFNMADPTQADALIQDSDRLLTKIEAVESYACGKHIETGRSVVLDDYEVALVVGFDSEADYTAYLEDPLHTEFLKLWSAQIDDIRIYDIHDPR